MLRGRIVWTQLRLSSAEAVVARGCPQGGVLSPLLWCLVVDSLLWRLNESGVYAQAYANDVTILVTEKLWRYCIRFDAESAEDRRRLVQCQNGRLSVNPSKTTIIPFNRRRKLDKLSNISMMGTEVPMSREVKFLGVTLDAKLTFNSHVENMTSKAISLLGLQTVLRKYIGFATAYDLLEVHDSNKTYADLCLGDLVAEN